MADAKVYISGVEAFSGDGADDRAHEERRTAGSEFPESNRRRSDERHAVRHRLQHHASHAEKYQDSLHRSLAATIGVTWQGRVMPLFSF